MTLDLSKIKEHASDPYENRKNYLNLKIQIETHKNRDYSVLTYKKSHGLGWKLRIGVFAFCLTIFTGFMGLAFPCVRNRWLKAFSGKSIKQIKILLPEVKSIEVPKTADFFYRGSNPEYLMNCSFEDFQVKAIPILNQRFPRPQTYQVDDEMHANEAEVLEGQLTEAGLTPIKIPKTLYDLFYWRFNMESRLESHIRDEDLNEIVENAQRKFDEGKSKVSYPLIKKYAKLYAYDKKGELSCHIPRVHVVLNECEKPYQQSIDKCFVKMESKENYQKILWHLNNEIISYFKMHNIDPQNLDWETMYGIVENLLNDIDQSYQNETILNKNNLLFGSFADFARTYQARSPRIKHFILGAIWHEYQASPDVYTIYRGAHVAKDNLESDLPYSFSFGHSPFSGIQYDGHSGSPLSYAKTHLYAVDVNIADYEKGGDAAQYCFIPPVRGPLRVAEEGEVSHVRSKVKLKTGDTYFYGFTGAPGVPKEELEFLVTHTDNEDEVKDHIKTSRVFFQTFRTVIVGDDC